MTTSASRPAITSRRGLDGEEPILVLKENMRKPPRFWAQTGVGTGPWTMISVRRTQRRDRAMRIGAAAIFRDILLVPFCQKACPSKEPTDGAATAPSVLRRSETP